MGGNPVDLRALSAGMLIGRLVLGLLIAAHGARKLLGWFGGHAPHGTGEFMAQLGFRAPGRRAHRPSRGSGTHSVAHHRDLFPGD